MRVVYTDVRFSIVGKFRPQAQKEFSSATRVYSSSFIVPAQTDKLAL